MQLYVFNNRKAFCVELLLSAEASTKWKKVRALHLACGHCPWLASHHSLALRRMTSPAYRLAVGAVVVPNAATMPPPAARRRGRLLPLLIGFAILALAILPLTFDSVGIVLPTLLPGSSSLPAVACRHSTPGVGRRQSL